MSSIDKLLAAQMQLMKMILRVLPNFKKLGQAKMTRAVTRQRHQNLKEILVRCQKLDGKISLYADKKLKLSRPYFVQQQFIKCEDAYTEATDFMAEVLAAVDPSPATNETTANVSFSSDFCCHTSHLPRINLPSFDWSFDK